MSDLLATTDRPAGGSPPRWHADADGPRQPARDVSFVVRASAGRGRGVFATARLDADEVLLRLDGAPTSCRDSTTVELEHDLHLAPGGFLWGLVNHACAPNCAVDLDRRVLRSVRTIAAGEELTFNYLTTEWRLAAPFACHCGAAHCPERILGLFALERSSLEPIRALVHPPLLRRWLDRHGSE